MKKAIIFVVLAMVVVGFCAAQSANEAQRLVGTWIGTFSNNTTTTTITYVFNANGTGTLTGADGKTSNIFWGISVSGEIYISFNNNGIGTRDTTFIKFAMSPDGKRLFCYLPLSSGPIRDDTPYGYMYLKK
jgi:hypothetical protein